MVARLGIATGSAVHGGLGKSGFDGENGFSFGGGYVRLVSRELEHLLHVFEIFRTRLDRLGIVFNVVIAVGQSDSTLVDVCDGHARVVHVRLLIEGEQSWLVSLVHIGDLLDHVGPGLQTIDARELGSQGRGAFLLDGGLIHTGGVEVAHFLLGCAVLAGGLRLVEDVAQDVKVLLGEFVETAPTRLVGRYGIVLHPVSTGVLVKVHTGLGRLVDCGYVKAGDLFGTAGSRGSGLGGTEDCGTPQEYNQKNTHGHSCLAS